MIAALIWGIIGLLSFVGHFATGLLDLIFPAIASLLTGLLSAVIPGLGDAPGLQILIWIVTCFGSLAFFRLRFGHLFKGSLLKAGDERSSFAGQTAIVLESIAPGQPGRISFHGSSWIATSIDETIEAGAKVYILEQEGLRFTVASKLLEEETENRLDKTSGLPPSLPPDT